MKTIRLNRWHWSVEPSTGPSGPWCIQKAWRTKFGLRFDPPEYANSKYRTKKEAEAAKRELRGKPQWGKNQ